MCQNISIFLLVLGIMIVKLTGTLKRLSVRLFYPIPIEIDMWSFNLSLHLLRCTSPTNYTIRSLLPDFLGSANPGLGRSKAEIYRWRIILADTDFFQQLVLVSAADFRDRNNRPSAKHFFLSNFWWILAEYLMIFLNFMCTLWHCKFDQTLSYSAKVCT